MAISMSPSQEDYLEGILIIQEQKRVIQVKDLAKFLKVKAPSVIEAIGKLKEKRLVVHERYSYIELTQEGINLAKKVHERHKTLKKFFHEVLGLRASIAEEGACKIEHYLSDETLKRMLKFIKFIETCPQEQPEWLSSFYYFAEHNKRPDSCPKRVSHEGKNRKKTLKLSDLKVGEKARLIKITDTGILKRKLLDMGLTRGEEVRIEKIALFGSPIDIVIRGYHLSIRKEEAERVIVEK